jgi:hypothetical protein
VSAKSFLGHSTVLGLAGFEDENDDEYEDDDC